MLLLIRAGHGDQIFVILRCIRVATNRAQQCHRTLGLPESQIGISKAKIYGLLIGAFRLKYPDVSLSLRIGASRDVQDWVEQGHVEIGVVGAVPSSRALESRPLMDDDLVLVVPPEHPWVSRNTVSVDDVKSEPLILRERGSGSRETLESGLKELGTGL